MSGHKWIFGGCQAHECATCGNAMNDDHPDPFDCDCDECHIQYETKEECFYSRLEPCLSDQEEDIAHEAELRRLHEKAWQALLSSGKSSETFVEDAFTQAKAMQNFWEARRVRVTANASA